MLEGLVDAEAGAAGGDVEHPALDRPVVEIDCARQQHQTARVLANLVGALGMIDDVLDDVLDIDRLLLEGDAVLVAGLTHHPAAELAEALHREGEGLRRLDPLEHANLRAAGRDIEDIALVFTGLGAHLAGAEDRAALVAIAIALASEAHNARRQPLALVALALALTRRRGLQLAAAQPVGQPLGPFAGRVLVAVEQTHMAGDKLLPGLVEADLNDRSEAGGAAIHQIGVAAILDAPQEQTLAALELEDRLRDQAGEALVRKMHQNVGIAADTLGDVVLLATVDGGRPAQHEKAIGHQIACSIARPGPRLLCRGRLRYRTSAFHVTFLRRGRARPGSPARAPPIT